MEEVKIIPINPQTFETQDYSTSDEELLSVSVLDTAFTGSTDYIELSVYDENQTLISFTEDLEGYSIKEGDVLLNPQGNLEDLGFDIDTYFTNYTFYRKRLSSSSEEKYFISNISSNRTEIEISSNQIEESLILSSTTEFIQYREEAEYFVDFYLNFGSNETIIANNIQINDGSVLIKLYEPLPNQYNLKSQFWIVEEISTPQAYQINFPFNITIPDDFTFIQGPNFNIELGSTTGKASQEFSYELLTNTELTSSYNELQNLLKEKEININVNYENFSEFTHFSSAKTRLENFYYKVGLIESSSKQINLELEQISGATTLTTAFSSSKATFTSQIENIIQNFDGYEKFLYYNSGSLYSYPKTNTSPPYSLASTGSAAVLNWIGSADSSNSYYGGVALSASNADQNNKDWLYWAIPEYLRDDSENAQYELFVDMVGQHYDNIWIYVKDIANKFNADNRLEYGISRDLVAEAIRDFGVKLYSNNFNTDDLFTAFLGLTPSGSLFPFPEITGSLNAPTGYEYVDTKVSSSNDVIPLDGVNKRLYKRIYHNIPYLLKTKGTIAGLRALITSYGIPDTILKINEFGGNDRTDYSDRNLEQSEFNFSYNTRGTAFFESEWALNPKWDASNDVANTVQFRFKTPGIPNPTQFSQSLWSINDASPTVVLEYTGSALVSGSYSGSIPDPYNTYATLKFIPDGTDQSISASLYLPFFDKGWWSVMTTQDGTNATIHAANTLEGKLNFTQSATVSGYDDNSYNVGTSIQFSDNMSAGGKIYGKFSGSYQEIRYFAPNINVNSFYDYVLNPYSIEGNSVNQSPEELVFRADLGSQLNTGSRISIHPKITGSASYPTSSFASDSDYTLNESTYFEINRENLVQNQYTSGIKDRVNKKIRIKSTILAEAPSGSNNDVIALSPLQSIQQTSTVTESFQKDINYLEVAFSPQDQIDNDITAQLGSFNLGDYIGDPRMFSSASVTYPDLDTLRNAYFDKYIKSYDVKDFVRLIKFFDNSLFKMIKDFVPTRTSLSSGVVIKQHILERNRQRPAQVTSSNETLSGSIKPQVRNYNTGSGNVGAYEYISGSSIYRFSGGTGGSFERYNSLSADPYYQSTSFNNFYLTQSYSESIEGSVANTITNSGSFANYSDKIPGFTSSSMATYRNARVDQREFYDGEFSGSHIVAATQSLNPGCAPYLKVVDTPVNFKPLFFSTSNNVLSDGTVTIDTFINKNNTPVSGDAWILYDNTLPNNRNQVIYIKLSALDLNNIFIRDYLKSSEKIEIIFPNAGSLTNGRTATEYFIDGVTNFADSVLLRISTIKGDNIVQGTDFFPITGSSNGGSENWSLIAQGSYTASGGNDNNSQGVFVDGNKQNQNQLFYYWDGDIQDAQGFFNTGSISGSEENILTNTSLFNNGAYNVPRTSNIPWYFSCSLAYSASTTDFAGSITSSGIFHSASSYTGVGLTDQSYTLSSGTPSGKFIPSPKITDLDSTYFKTTYNSLIPGNSGSDTAQGGHPQTLLPGTASLDFTFPSLTLAGSSTLPTNVTIITPFSGSTKRGANGDFVTSLNSIPGNGISLSSYSASRDGAITVDEGFLEAYQSTHPDGFPGEPLSIPSVQLAFGTYNIEYTFTASAALDITASYQYKVGSAGYTSANSSDWEYGSSGTWAMVSSGISIPGGSNQTIDWRPALISPETSFSYNLTKYKVTIAAQFTCDYGGGNIQTENRTFYLDVASPIQNGALNIFRPESTSGGTVGTADMQVLLKTTGSEGERIITGSQLLSNHDVYPGVTYTFSASGQSPIEDIFNSNKASANTQSTITQEGDMYFIEYSMSNFTPGTATGFNTADIDFIESGDTGTELIISQSLVDTSGTYIFSGSLYIKQGNDINKSSLGSNVFNDNNNFSILNASSTGRVNLTGSFTAPFNYDDTFRMGLSVVKSFSAGATITEYTMSIFPSQSINTTLPSLRSAYNNYDVPTSTGFILPTFFGSDVLPFERALDCQPLLNNYNSQRDNSFLMNVYYNNVTGSLLPVNFEQILSGSAVKATIPDSNYTSTRIINPRYLGSKSTGQQYNVWNIQDTGTYGKSPVIELRNAYFAYFNSVVDFYPLVNDITGLNITYLVDQQGNAIPPSLDKGIYLDTLEKTFDEENKVTISILTGSNIFQNLNDQFDVVKLTAIPTPISYTQIGSSVSASSIPLSSSRRISNYDNDDLNSFNSYSFTAEGTSSFSSNSVTSFNEILSPSYVSSGSNDKSPAYNITGTTASIQFPNTDISANDPELSQDYLVSVDTLIDTSYANESGNIEFEFKLILEKSTDAGSTYESIPPTVEDIRLYVLDGGTSKLIGSVARGEDDVIRFVTGKLTGRSRRKRRKYGLNRKDRRIGSESPVVNSNNEIEVVIENYAVNDLLKANGYNIETPTYTLQWRFTAHSGNNKFNQEEYLRWRISGFTRGSNVIFPGSTPQILPTRIKMVGSKDHLISADNTATRPFWVYSGSAGGGTNIISSSILVMSSSNYNEAYGPDSFQGDIGYSPGTSEYFPGGSEPIGTQFPTIDYPLEIVEGDEIRFGNNENYSYRITKVIPPQENIEGNSSTGPKARLKIELDGEVPKNINKDFFIIRRYIPSANSIILDSKYPYATPPSSSIANGIAFPPFPGVELEASASAIITELTSKGIIT